jgi:PAS domain S-box-containing protein
LSPFRKLDAAYTGFIQLIAGQVAATLANVRAAQAEEAQRRLQLERDEVLARLQLQFERMPIACVAFDPQGRVIEWNPAAETTFGYGRDEVIGRHGFEILVPPALHPQLHELVARLTSGDMSAHSMNENLTKDGRTIICEWRNTPLLDASGEVVGLLSMVQDVTERIRVQEALNQVNRRFDLALKGSDIGVWEIEIGDGEFETVRIAYTNVWEQLGYPRWGWTPDLATAMDLAHPEDRTLLPDAYRRCLAGTTDVLEFEQRLRHYDGSYRTMLMRGVVIRDAAGKPTRMIGSRVDITVRKRAEQALRASEARLAGELAGMKRLQEVSTRLVQAKDSLSLLEEIVGAAIAITSADMGNIQLLDRATGELTIVASQGFEDPFLDYFNTVHARQAACGTAMERQERVVIEDVTTDPIFAGSPALQVVLAAGVRAVQCTPLVGRSGRTVGMLSTHYRTTRRPIERDLEMLDLLARQAADWIERNHAEGALRDSEERFRRLFEVGTIGRAITSPTKGCLEVNDGLCSILGYDRAELLQKSWWELTHPDDLAADHEQFDRVMSGESDGYSLDKRFIRKDGSVVDTTLWVNCVRREDGTVDYFVAVVQDITERKRAEEALRESEERYRSLISQVREFAIFSTDVRGIVTAWNEGCQFVLGYSQQEFIGLDTAELFTPEDRAQGILTTELRQARETGTASTERWMIAKEGRRFFAVGATAAFRDSAGRVIGFSRVVRDVTPMKEYQDQLAQRGESLERLVSERTGELEETTQRLRVSERMAGLGTLAAGLGHDMGNLLLPMDVRLGLLIEADLPRELHEHVVGIQKCARYLQRLSSGLRLLATDPAHVESRGATDLGRWWNDVRIILKDVLPGGIRFEDHLPEAESWVAMGRTGLTQAVYNLVQNAADALKEHGGSRVSVSAENDPSVPWITLRVADDGPGMSEETARRCMEPYFSTKARGQSTGMGLSLVHGLVIGAGGQVEVQSAPGQGTTISLILPRPLPKEQTQDSQADVPEGVAHRSEGGRKKGAVRAPP